MTLWHGAGLALALVFSGCIDGGTVSGPLSPNFLGDSIAEADADGEAGETDGTDVADGDVSETDGDITDTEGVGPDADADIAVEVEVSCTPGDAGCEICTTDPECATAFDDGNLCNGTWTCVDGACAEAAPVDPATLCADKGEAPACHDWACTPESGACGLHVGTNGGACNDGDPCTRGDRCDAGTCASGIAMICEDGNPCTAAKCGPDGCEFTPRIGDACDDGSVCSPTDSCVQNPDKSTVCVGPGLLCGCSIDEDCLTFEDANACNGTLRCLGGQCRVAQATVIFCLQDEDPCTASLCDPISGLCETADVTDGGGCDDGDACTTQDKCTAGLCAGAALDCGAGPCWTGSCDSESGACVQTAADDDSACTASGGCDAAATCQGGGCVTAPGACECAVDADCAASEDDDLCNGTLSCVVGRCVVDPATVVQCAPDGPCATEACAPATGECAATATPDGVPCDDFDACTSDDRCTAGACGGQACPAAVNPCMVAQCNPTTGCAEVSIGITCTAENACVAAATCAGGVCNTVVTVECPEGGACVDTACNSSNGACADTNLDMACDDGDACTSGDACQAGVCVGEPMGCDDGNPCTDDVCADGACVAAANTAVCDDGNACSKTSQCAGGTCQGSNFACECEDAGDCVALDDGDICNGTLTCLGNVCVVDAATIIICDATLSTACTVNACQPDGNCALDPRANGSACEDGNACTSGDVCAGGDCLGAVVSCGDETDCATFVCDPTLGCLAEPKSGFCNDGNSCTTIDACFSGACVGVENTCECVNDSECVDSDDANLCNGTLACISGACAIDPATVVDCGPSDDICGVVACDAVSGSCVAGAAPGMDGAACEDGNPCSLGDSCVAGTCAAGAPKPCDEGGQCAVGACEATSGACVYAPITADCDDGNPCTGNDFCDSGSCVGASVLCPCTLDTDCDAFATDLCAEALTCGALGCEPIAESGVVCDTVGDTACALTTCAPNDGLCSLKSLAVGAHCATDDACVVATTCNAEGACEGEALDCDDGNPCTVDTCDSETGCAHTAGTEGAPCDDGDACSSDTLCSAGVCGGGTNACACVNAGQCPAVADLCTGTYTCTDNLCVKGDPVVCTESSAACKAFTCAPGTGLCGLEPMENSTPCDDGNPCTVDDRCVIGLCGGTNLGCDDGEACTADACEGGFCVNTPLDETPCDDGDSCTVFDECNDGRCAAGTDICGCTVDSDCTPFDDGNFCNGVWGCVDDVCAELSDSEVVCPDVNPFDCVVFECVSNTGDCFPEVIFAGSDCTDGSLCTEGDQCDNAGNCVGVDLVTCLPSTNPCAASTCDPQSAVCGVVNLGAETACDDNNPCTIDDHCAQGTCTGTAQVCDDGNPCTDDGCSAASGCYAALKPTGTSCDDGDPCTSDEQCNIAGICAGTTGDCTCTGDGDCAVFDDGDLCNGTFICGGGGVCEAQAPVDCSDENEGPCGIASCDALGGDCVVAYLTGPACDDGDPCTEGDACAAGECVGTSALCDDGNPCTVGACDPVQGCYPVLTADGAGCDDGLACNGEGACQGGVCTPGADETCPCSGDGDCAAFEDGDVCNGTLVCGPTGQCEVDPTTKIGCAADPSGCVFSVCNPGTGDCELGVAPDGSECSDGDSCTSGDVCSSSFCVGTVLDCYDGNLCTDDICDPDFGCLAFLGVAACDDGNPCTSDDRCALGVCSGTPTDCDDDNPCTFEACTPGIGCVAAPIPDDDACDDGQACTENDRCTAGVCGGDLAPDCGCVAAADCDSTFGVDLCVGAWACSAEGACFRQPGAALVCQSAGCIDAVCDPPTGSCVNTFVADGEACDDGDICTSETTCGSGECTGGTITECAGGDGACLESTCIKGVGCAIVQPQAACDDGNSCSVDDRCVSGTCIGGLPMPWGETFVDGDVADWTLISTGAAARWQVSAFGSTVGALGLYAAHPDTGTLIDPRGVWSASATTPVQPLPADALVAQLSFRLNNPGTPGTTFEVSVDAASVPVVCAPGPGGFEFCTGDLGDHLGSTEGVTFTFSVDDTADTGAYGVAIDDIQIFTFCSF